jgi:quercetin dioxygenase-like cupin family protein
MRTLAGLIVCGAALVPQEKAAVEAVALKDVKWAQAKGMPDGVMSCLLHGDPATGPVVSLNRFPAGAVIPPHTHGADEVSTVVSGAAWIGQGERIDESKGTLVEAGGHVKIPAKVPHWAKAKAETVIVRYSPGPLDVTWCEKR